MMVCTILFVAALKFFCRLFFLTIPAEFVYEQSPHKIPKGLCSPRRRGYADGGHLFVKKRLYRFTVLGYKSDKCWSRQQFGEGRSRKWTRNL